MTKETWEAVGKYGLATVLVFVFLWAMQQYMIEPANEERMDAREERKATAKALVDSNREVNTTNRSLADSYSKMADGINKLTTGFDTLITVTKELRDDTRKFPAVREFTKSENP